MTPRDAVRSMFFMWATASAAWSQQLWTGFQRAAEFDEQVRWSRLDSGVRVMLNAPLTQHTDQRLLVVYATPNGSTIEQTLGCAAAPDRDWKYDIQHVAAQVRLLRELDRSRDIVLAVVQAPQLSWPAPARHNAAPIS